MTPPARPYRVCILGASLDTGNRGVSALAASLVTIIRALRPEARFSLFIVARSGHPQEVRDGGESVQIDVLNLRLSPRAPLRENFLGTLAMAFLYRISPGDALKRRILAVHPVLGSLAGMDFIGDIRGGDSFSDIYGTLPFVAGAGPAAIVLLLGRPLALLPQTYGPYDSRIARAIARAIMRRSCTILSRDLEGLNVVESLVGSRPVNGRVRFCPDVAFCLEPSSPDGPEETRASRPGSRLVGLNISGLLYNGGYNRKNMFGLRLEYRAFVHALAARIAAIPDIRLLLVPHTFGPPGNINSDPDACRRTYEAIDRVFRERVHLVEGEKDAHAIKGLIGRCDFFIGSRMHACIAALSQGIPTIAVAYSRKFHGVFDAVGAGSMVIDARRTDGETAIETIVGRITGAATGGHADRVEPEKIRRQVMDTFAGILP